VEKVEKHRISKMPIPLEVAAELKQ
jgi:hypothetical protein